MAKKGSFSKVYDKNGDYVDVEAARFDGSRTFQMQGDVTATQTWNGDSASALTLNTSIGAKKVTTDKINDKAVQTGQIDDGAVGLTQIATNAMNGTVQDNDSKLATHAAVKTYVDSQISGQGTYLGKHTVAEINAMVTDNLHNGDRVMTSDSGTINLGPGGVGFDVEAGEDLILYKSGSTVQWDSMDGNFKTKQTAVSDPTASGTGLTFIDSISQDENGEITPSKKSVQDGTTSQKGVVQLEDSHSSTSTTKAATPNSVKEAYDLANTANTGAVKNVAYDSTNKKITKTINGQTTDVVSAATLKTDMALNNVDNTSDANKPVSTAQQAALDLKQNSLPTSGTAKTTYAINISGKASSSNDVVVEEIGNTPIDLDTLTASDGHVHFYYWDLGNASNVSNRPTDHSYTLQVLPGAGIPGAYVTQIAYRRGTVDAYIRRRSEGSTPWGGWAKLANKTEVDAKADKVSNATSGNFAGLDSSGNLTDSGNKASDFATSAQGSKADSAIQGVKVNATTLTPDANKVVTVPLATTSADGAMSAADKTKLEGIEAGAGANVQADWAETSSSADSFIKNKPYYSKSQNLAGSFKVCTMPKLENGAEKTLGLELTYVKGYGGLKGTLLYKRAFNLYLEYCNAPWTGSKSITFKYVENESTVDLYAVTNGTSVTLKVAPLANMPKSDIDFTNFGTTATVPETAVAITPVWVANSASSSGTAPVKVDAYGALTPVPMDSTPTASSTNLMTSGDIKTAMDAVSDNVYPWHEVGGGGTTNTRKVCDILIPYTNNYNGLSYIFDYGSDYNSIGNPSSSGKVKVRLKTNGTSEPTYYMTITKDAGPYQPLTDPTFKLYKKYDSTAKKLYLVLAAQVGSNYYNGLSCRINGCLSQSGANIASHVTMATNTEYTPAVDYSEVTTNVSTIRGTYAGLSFVGSSSVPVYANSDGELKACTDDFARDSEVVTSVQKETVSNVTKLTYTKNGSKTDIVEFMTTAEAQSLWTNAKAAVANAS